MPARGFVNSLQLISVPPRNVQPDKWISNKARKEQVERKKIEKKERRRIKRHPADAKVNGDGPNAMEADGAETDAEQDDGVDETEKEGDEEDQSDEDMNEEGTVAAPSKQVKTVAAKADPEILLLASLAKEPRLGRWEVMKERSIRNGTLIVHLGKQAS